MEQQEDSKEKTYCVYFANGTKQNVRAAGFENSDDDFLVDEEIVAVFLWDQLIGIVEVRYG